MDCDHPQSGYVDFEIERKCGRLSGTTSKLYFNNKVVGEIDENNLVHWNASVTLDDLKSIIQTQLDYTRWQVNRMLASEGKG